MWLRCIIVCGLCWSAFGYDSVEDLTASVCIPMGGGDYQCYDTHSILVHPMSRRKRSTSTMMRTGDDFGNAADIETLKQWIGIAFSVCGIALACLAVICFSYFLYVSSLDLMESVLFFVNFTVWSSSCCFDDSEKAPEIIRMSAVDMREQRDKFMQEIEIFNIPEEV